MLHRLIENETAADPLVAPGGDPAGEPASPDAATPAAAGESDPPADVTPAPPAGIADDPRLAELVDERALALLEQRLGPITQLLEGALAEPAADPAAQLPQLTLDPFSETYGQDLAAFLAARDEQLFAKIDQRLDGVTQPFEQAQQAAVLAEGEQRIQDIIADDLTRNGDIGELGKQLIQPIAETLVPAIAARYGDTPRAAELAIARAADQVRALEAAAEKRGAERRENELRALGGASRELGGRGAAGTPGLPEARTMSEVTSRYAPLLRADAGL